MRNPKIQNGNFLRINANTVTENEVDKFVYILFRSILVSVEDFLLISFKMCSLFWERNLKTIS